MNTTTIPACCGLPMILHNRPIPGTNTFAPVFRCPICTRGYAPQIASAATGIALGAGRYRAA